MVSTSEVRNTLLSNSQSETYSFLLFNYSLLILFTGLSFAILHVFITTQPMIKSKETKAIRYNSISEIQPFQKTGPSTKLPNTRPPMFRIHTAGIEVQNISFESKSKIEDAFAPFTLRMAISLPRRCIFITI